MRDLFQFVELYSPPNKWRRVKLGDIDGIVKNNAFNIYHSVQRFKFEVKTPDEPHWCPIYFDFDLPIRDKEPSDEQIKSHILQSIEITRKEILAVADFFINLGVDKDCISFSFSGMKGFHLSIVPEPFGIIPRKDLSYIIKLVAVWLTEYLTLTTIDTAVYSIPRQWRILNTIHPKSKLYAIPLDYNSVVSFTKEQILQLAAASQQIADDVDFSRITVDRQLYQFWSGFVKQYDTYRDNLSLSPRKPIDPSKPIPVCIIDLLENSIRQQGTRNRAVIVLTTYFRDAGVSEQDAITRLSEWSGRIPSTLSYSPLNQKLSEVRAVVKTVYSSSEKYHFSCAFIRALSAQNNPIKCLYESCTTTSANDMQIERPIETSLENAVNSVYINIPLKVRATISGKEGTPFVVPYKLKIACNPDGTSRKCQMCNMLTKNGKHTIELKQNDSRLIEMINISSDQMTGLLKKISGIPSSCHIYNLDITEHINLYDLLLIPSIEIRPDTVFARRSFVERRAISTCDVDSNTTYDFECILLPDPKSQYAMLLCYNSERTALDIDTAVVDVNQLEIFRAGDTFRECKEKYEQIYRDFSANILKIHNRFDMFVGMDLPFFSPLGIMYGGDFIKGWIDCIIIGDTRQGKTWMAERLAKHYQAGHLVSGETSSRTGLMFSFHQSGKGKWGIHFGVLPLADRRLVLIDEFGDVNPDEVKKMSQARSSGVLDVQGVVNARTPVRTRLIMLTNPPRGLKINQFNYGVLILKDIFQQPEDIARLDYALTVASGEVSLDSIITVEPTEHIYTSQRCSSHVKFAWGLKVEDIDFPPESIRSINNAVHILCQRYTAQIPLVEPTEMRYKLARLSAAVAVRLFSYYAGKIIVKPCHIEFIFWWLSSIYSKSSMGYDLFSDTIGGHLLDEISRKDVKTMIRLTFGIATQSFIRVMLQSVTFRRKTIQEQFGLSDGEIRGLFPTLTQHSLIRSTTSGYVKNDEFIAILKELHAEIEQEKRQTTI